jgi:hypothetical protein
MMSEGRTDDQTASSRASAAWLAERLNQSNESIEESSERPLTMDPDPDDDTTC